MFKLTKQMLAQYIDHTLLKADAGDEDLKKLCKEARELGVFSVCVNPCNVEKAKKYLETDEVKVAAVVGFPLGQTTMESKAYETHEAIFNGADEIDMVINVGRLKDKDYEYVKDDISAVVLAAKGHVVKVILETCLLDEDENHGLSIGTGSWSGLCQDLHRFSTSGAHIEDIKLMRATVGEKMGVKASGGIRTLKDAVKMIDAGATRLGLSATVNILNELDE